VYSVQAVSYLIRAKVRPPHIDSEEKHRVEPASLGLPSGVRVAAALEFHSSVWPGVSLALRIFVADLIVAMQFALETPFLREFGDHH